MPRFKSKIVEIDAWQYEHGRNDLWPEWLSAAYLENRFYEDYGCDPHIVISTPEGEMRGNAGDWIIQGTEGELYPCKDTVFRRKYGPAD